MNGLQNKREKEFSVLTAVQMKKLLDYVSNRADLARQNGSVRAIIDELIIFLLIYAGLRPAEVCRLTLENLPLNNERNMLFIAASDQSAAREIKVNSALTECIARFIRVFRNEALPNEPLLVNERGSRFTYRSLYNKVKTVGANAGIGSLYPHILRNTFILRLYNEAQDMHWVRQQAGHQSTKAAALCIRNLTNYPKKVKTGCEACGKLISSSGTKIDSGQILCDECLKYFK